MKTPNQKTHQELCNFVKELTLKLLESEGINTNEFSSYDWESGWFKFSYGLGGEVEYLDKLDDNHKFAIRGANIREMVSKDSKELLSDISYVTPCSPGIIEPDDFDCVRDYWGVLTELSSDLRVKIPDSIMDIIENEN